MSPIQDSVSMPQEWLDQLHELAYGQPAEPHDRPLGGEPLVVSRVRWWLNVIFQRSTPALRA
jgi:hypothetical protein